MDQRDVTGLPRLDTQRYADQINPHGIQPRGFGIYSHIAALVNPLDPYGQGIHILDPFVFFGVKWQRFWGINSGGGLDNLGGFDPHLAGHAFGQGAKLHLGQKIHQHLWLGVPHLQTIQCEIQIHIRHQPDQFA